VELNLTINGEHHKVEAEPTDTLLQVIRGPLALTGTKEACVEGECGACTVLIDGKPIDSCIYPALAADQTSVTTIEGINNPDGSLTPLQDALVRLGGIQCGFCTPGFIVTLTALLAENPTPTAAEVSSAIVGNLCRCTGYSQIVDAVLAAAGEAS
jgi:carbon-monoxide dehydrogenase small subunit